MDIQAVKVGGFMRKKICIQFILVMMIQACISCQSSPISYPFISTTRVTPGSATPFGLSTPSPQISLTTPTEIIKTEPTTEPTATVILIPTQPPTRVPTRTPTNTPTIIPTLTPLPTLVLEESQKELASLLATNGGCQFPCLWGWQPDPRLAGDLQNFMDHFGKYGDYMVDHTWISDPGKTYVFFEIFRSRIRKYYLNFEYDFRPENNFLLLQIMGFNLKEELGYYSLTNILEAYGKPEQIFVSADPEEQMVGPTDLMEFNLVLFYPQQGVYIEYILTRSNDGTYFYGCPDEVNKLYLLTWDPMQKMPVVEIID